jgi:hypothetical protein
VFLCLTSGGQHRLLALVDFGRTGREAQEKRHTSAGHFPACAKETSS